MKEKELRLQLGAWVRYMKASVAAWLCLQLSCMLRVMFLNVGSAWKGGPNPMFPAASCGRIGTGQQDCKTEHTSVKKGAGIFSHNQY
jgi:hypothetical protein